MGRSRSRGRSTRISHESDEDLFDNAEDSFAKERDTVRLGKSGREGRSLANTRESRRLESTLELDSIRARREAPAVGDRRKSAKKKQRKQAKADEIFESSEEDEDAVQFQDEGFSSGNDDIDDEEEDEDDEDDDSDLDTSVWGNQRKAYYGADVLHRNRNEDPDDLLSKSRAALLEEEEAKRLRKQATFGMRLEDFGDAPAADGKEARSEESEAEEEKTKKTSAKKQKGEERVVKDISGLSDEQKLKILQNDAPELLNLIDEFQTNATTLNDVIAPLLEKVKQSDDPDIQTSQGLTYLEAKYHLMLSYCTNLSYYFLLKASGRSPKDHPVVDQLVRLRLLIEKIRPLDQKLKYQLDKLLRLATLGPASGSADQRDPLSFRPRIDNLDEDGSDDDDAAKTTNKTTKSTRKSQSADDSDEELYEAPRISARSFGGDLDKKKKQAERQHAKLAQSSMMQFLQEEFGSAPRAMDAGSSKSARGQDDSDDEEEERTRFEEEYMVRLPVTKQQKKKQKEKQQRQNITLSSELNQLDDFGDIAGLVAKPTSKSLGHYLNEIDQAHTRKSSAREHSGDADLPISSGKASASHNDKRSRSKGRGFKKDQSRNKFARRR